MTNNNEMARREAEVGETSAKGQGSNAHEKQMLALREKVDALFWAILQNTSKGKNNE